MMWLTSHGPFGGKWSGCLQSGRIGDLSHIARHLHESEITRSFMFSGGQGENSHGALLISSSVAIPDVSS